MDTATIVATLALIVIVGLAIRYLVKAKTRNIKCLGCPLASCCPSGSQPLGLTMKPNNQPTTAGGLECYR